MERMEASTHISGLSNGKGNLKAHTHQENLKVKAKEEKRKTRWSKANLKVMTALRQSIAEHRDKISELRKLPGPGLQGPAVGAALEERVERGPAVEGPAVGPRPGEVLRARELLTGRPTRGLLCGER